MTGSGGQASLPHSQGMEEVSLARVVRVGDERKEGKPGRTVVEGDDNRRGGAYEEMTEEGDYRRSK